MKFNYENRDSREQRYDCMASKNCKRCIYYSPSRNYCLKLMVHVSDPDDPVCLKPSNNPRASVLQELETRNSPTNGQLGISGGFGPLVRRPIEPVQVQRRPQIEVLSDFSALESYRLPAEFREHYTSTGIPLLDEILGGGFIRGKTYLVAGETGCGKTIFSLQYLVYGALHGEPGLYIAIDEPTDQLISGLKKFGWDVTPLVKKRRLMFLDMRTHFSKIYLRDERRRIEPKYIIESILESARKIGAKRLVIDPIAPLIYGGSEDDILYAREFLREMVFAIERTKQLTTIMTSEIPTGSRRLSRFGVEEFLATGIIVLGLEEIGGRIERIMFIRKARWAPVRPSKYVFEIIPGTGIVIKSPLEEVLKQK